MYKIKHFLYISLLSLFVLSGCSNIDVGFEKGSVFHSSQKNEKLENSIVNVYLDKSTDVADKYRLVINGEDTELDLYYNVLTRFEINKEKTTIELLKNGIKVMDFHITLASAKNYFLIVKIDENSQHPLIAKIDKQQIAKGTKATPIFASEEIVAQDEVKQVKELQKQKKEAKKEFIAKKNIGIVKSKEPLKTKIKSVIQQYNNRMVDNKLTVETY